MTVSAVATTGIYCRPGCSARPLPENVTTYPTPVAAEAAGYRSCLRCRPDRHLRTTDTTGVPAPVATALALISDGYLDRFDETTLATQVGYSTRQLRRLFERHIGATPAFVARSRRAHFARRLLDETDLAMPVVASAAGFGSTRQMHRVMESIFGFSPSRLRSRRRPGDVLVADGGLRLRLPLATPFHRRGALDHLRPRATPSVEAVDGTRYRRTLVVCGNPGVIEVDLAGPVDDDTGADHLELVAHLPTFDSIIDDVARIRTMFGLDDDPAEAAPTLLADDLLAPLVEAGPGRRVIGGWDRFETAVRVVIGQQVSVAGATTLAGRLVEAHGPPLPATVAGLGHVFPPPDALVDLDPNGLGMPRSRVATIEALARAVLDGTLDLYGASEPGTLRRQMLALPGVGPWTADVVAMRSARDPDAFPAGDLGLRQALGRLLGTDDVPNAEDVAAHAERWRPHRALAAQYLWASLAPPPTPTTTPAEMETP